MLPLLLLTYNSLGTKCISSAAIRIKQATAIALLIYLNLSSFSLSSSDGARRMVAAVIHLDKLQL